MDNKPNRDEPMSLVIGSYTDSMPHVRARGAGISFLSFDPKTGKIQAGSAYSDIRNPTYLALSESRRRLYAVEELSEEDGADVLVFDVDPTDKALSVLSRVPAYGDCPCHVSFDLSEHRMFISNYVNGSFAAYALDADGLPQPEGVRIDRTGTGPNPDRQECPHAHQGVATPDGLHVLVCDAGTDQIARYGISGTLIDKEPNLVIKTDGGSMPRHLAFSPDGSRFFVVHELGCSVNGYAYDADGIRFLSRSSTLPEGWSGDSNCAAIRMHPNGKFLYASNRGHNSIVLFDISGGDEALRPIGWYGTRGETPRDFNIDPSGRFLIAANQDSHSLAAFSIDPESGALTPIGDTFEIGSPVCVLFG